MLVNTITSSNCTPQTIVIGRRGTYDTMQIAFDLTYLVENYGSGTAVLAVKRSQDESAYPAVVTQDGNTLTWTISETDTYYVGSGECQLMWYVDGGLAKTIIYPMIVMRDILATSEEAPDAYQTWVDDLTALGAETLQNAQNAAQSASDAESAKDDAVDAKEAAEEAAETAQEAVVHAPIIQNGYWYIWNDGQYVDTGVRAEGQKGDKGDTGEKGDTGNGIASITKTGTSGLVDTYTVTYTDGTTTTFTVTNGAKGDKGDTGATGNGIQSITKTGTSGNVDTYTITYTNGQTVTFTVTNGAVSSVAGKTGAVALDAGDIGYDSTETYTSGTVGAELGDLTRHLSDTDSALNVLKDGKALFDNWGIGIITATVGQIITINTAFTNRVYCKDAQTLDYDTTIAVATGYKFYVIYVDNNDMCLAIYTVSGGGSKTVPANTRFYICGEKPTPEAIGDKIDEYINAITYTLETELLYGQVDDANKRINYNVNAIENLFDGEQYLTNFLVGGLNNDGSLNPSATSFISSSDWFIPEYPYFVSKDSAYLCRLWFDDSGAVSYVNIDEYGNLMFPGRKTKVCLWKDGSSAALDINDAKRKVTVQTKDDYLAKHEKMIADKAYEGFELFNGFVRRGVLGASGVYVDYIRYRCATPYVCRFSRDIRIKSKTGFRFAIHTFDSSDIYVADLGWKTDYTIAAGQGFRLMIARTTENTSETADPDTFIQQLNVVSVFAVKSEVDAGLEALKEYPLDKGFMQNGGKPHLSAHGGYHVSYPYNSNPAYEAAGLNRFWGIEGDVNQTSDNHFVMIHDVTVDSSTDGTGSVNEMTLAEIRALHLTGTQYQVPTLEEYLSICKRYGCVPILEIKSTVTKYAELVEIIKAFGLEKSLILIGSKWSLSHVRAVTTEIPYMSIYQLGFTVDFDDELEFNAAYDNTGMCWDYTFTPTLEEAKKLHDENMVFGTFTVDNASDVLAAFAAGVDFVTTNTVLPYGNS